MSRFRLSRTASRELDEIFVHIGRDNLDAAIRYLERLENKLEFLADTPRAGRSREWTGPNVLCFPVDNYVFYYAIRNYGIYVMRVLHASRQQFPIIDDSEE